MFPKKENEIRPYIFSNNWFMITGFDEDETYMFQVEGESVLQLKKTGSCQVRHNDEEDVKHEDIVLEEAKLTVKINQGGEGQSLRVVK